MTSIIYEEVKDMKKAQKYGIIGLIAVCCITMALVETVIEPAYTVKSSVKIVVFSLLPILVMRRLNVKVFERSLAPDRRKLARLLLLGGLIYGIIMAAFALTRGIFDYSALVASLSSDQKVSGFIGVALYISFCNSFLEEFLFRQIAFIKLSAHASRAFAYTFSSIMFALYHVAMIGAAFPLPLLILAVIGLAAGGCIFNYADEKSGDFYSSWIIHMFADFAIMTIWYIYK